MSTVQQFECPDCKAPCVVSVLQRGVRHSLPECKTWKAHKGNMQEFLKLALMAKGGAAFNLGEVKIDASPEEREKKKAELIDELNEGLKTL